MLLHLNAIFTLVCVKRLVIFLTCGEVYVKVAHFVSVPVVVGSLDCVVLCCILCFSLTIRFKDSLLLCTICTIFFHSSCCCFSPSGRVSILLMRDRYAASLCSSGWLVRKLMVVSVAVGLQYMPISRQVAFLVTDRPMKQLLQLVSCVGLSWMPLWIVSMYCSMFSGVIHVES